LDIFCQTVPRAIDFPDTMENYIGQPFRSGQPMGSLMSFPLLCLINRTAFELAVLRALGDEKISHREARAVRVRINGDDLLTKEPRVEPVIYDYLLMETGTVGLKLNKLKTIVDPRLMEINSTLFEEESDGRIVEKKKTNCGVLSFDGLAPIIDNAHAQTRTIDGFLMALRCTINAFGKYPFAWRSLSSETHLRAAIMAAQTCKSLREELMTVRSDEDTLLENEFPVAKIPSGYYLPRQVERLIVRNEVRRIREVKKSLGPLPKKADPEKLPVKARLNSLSVETIPREQVGGKASELTLKTLVDAWEREKLNTLLRNESKGESQLNKGEEEEYASLKKAIGIRGKKDMQIGSVATRGVDATYWIDQAGKTIVYKDLIHNLKEFNKSIRPDGGKDLLVRMPRIQAYDLPGLE